MAARSTGSVALRLGLEGKDEVKTGLAEIGASGDAAAKRAAAAFERAGDDIAAATKRQQDAAQKLAALNPGGVASIERAGPPTALYRAYQQEQAQLQRQAEALRNAIDPMRVAQARYDQEIGAAATLLAKGKIEQREYAAAVDLATASLERARSAQAKPAPAPVAGIVGGDADAHVRAYAADRDQQVRQAEALRRALDPLRASQQQYDTELATYAKLLRTGTIDQQEHDAGVARSKVVLEEAKKALEGHTEATGLNRTQQLMLKSAAFNAYSSLAAGMPLWRVLSEQGIEVAQAMFMGDKSAGKSMEKAGEAAKEGGGVAGKAIEELKDKAVDAGEKIAGGNGLAGAGTKIAALFGGPVGIAVAGTTALVLAGTVAWISYTNAVAKLDAIGGGAGAVIGANGQKLEQQAEAAARAGNMSVSAARDIEAGYVKMGGIGLDTLAGLTAMTENFAAATGGDAKSAQDELGKAFQDPIQGAQDLATRYGALTQAQVEQIQQLVEQGRLYEAQKRLLLDLQPAFDGAADHARGFGAAFHDIGVEISNAASRLAAFLAGAGSAIPAAQRLVAARERLAKLDASGVYAPGLRANAQAEIEALQTELTRERSTKAAPGNAARQAAQDASDRYTGDQRSGLVKTIGTLEAGIRAGGTPEQIAAWTAALDANRRAKESWIPQQQKANELAAADAKIAAARTPAQKAAATADREMIALKGTVVTKADAEARAHAEGAKALATASRAGAGHAATLARDAASMDANARATLALADAYLESGSAAIVAEASRKALTDATKKGIDVEAEIRRQLALNVAEGVAAGAKSTASLRAELDARKAANDNMAAGKLAAADLTHALSDEAALRPLLTLRTIAHGEALEKLNAIIDRYRATLAAAHEEEKRSAAIGAIDASKRTVAGMRDEMEFAGDRTGRGEVEIARRGVMRDADKYGAQTGAVADQKAEEIRTKQALDRKIYVAGTLNDQRDELELARTELQLLGKSDETRQRALDKLKAIQELRRRGIDADSAEGQEILAGVDAQDQLTQAIQRSAAAMDEVRGFAGGLIEQLAQGKISAKALLQEFLKLAAINPLKNLLGGQHQSTLGDVLGSITKVLGTGGISTSEAGATASGAIDAWQKANPLPKIPGFAGGTDSAPGGLAWVAENGPELINLPKGASVTPAPQTRRMMQAANDRGSVVNHYHIAGNLLTPEFWAQINAGDDGAAMRGAAGGAAMGEAQTRATGRRQLGRRW